MKCPRCQQENPAEQKLCGACGTPLAGAAQAWPYADLKEENEKLRRSLTEALEQQTATSEILRVISQSPADVKPVFEVITDSAMRLFSAWAAAVFRYEGQLISMAAARGGLPGSADAVMKHLQVPHAPTEERPEGRTVLTRTIQHVIDVENDMSWGPRYREDARARGFRSYVAVPMLRGDVVVGVITVSRQRVGGFASGEISLLQTFADQAVIAIENIRLFNETKEALEQQTATSEILRVISSSPTSLQPVLDAVAENAARVCGASDALIRLLEGDVLRLVANYGPIPGVERVPLDRRSVLGRAVSDRRTIHIHDLAAEPEDEFSYGKSLQRRFGHRTVLATPLFRQGTPIGGIVIRRLEMQPFSEKQIELLKTFADQAVIAIENVRLFNETKEALEQQTATSEILRVISSSPTDVQPVFDTIVKSVARLCDGMFASLHRFDGEHLHWVAQHNFTAQGLDAMRSRYPMRAGRDTASGRAVLDRAVVHIRDFETDPAVPATSREISRAFGYRSLITVPLLREGQPLGAIAVARRDGPFSAAQIALLQTFADQAVIAIENVRLFTELQEKNQALTQAHGQVTEALEQQTATSDILRAISSSPTDVQPVFEAIARSAVRLCRGVHSGVLRLNDDVLFVVAHENLSAIGADMLLSLYPTSPDRAGLVGLAVRQRAIVHAPDVQRDSRAAHPELARRAGYSSVLAVPIMRSGEPIGAIFVTSTTPFAATQLELLKTFADQAVIAIENVRLFRELEARNRDLTETLAQQAGTAEVLKVISSSPTDLRRALHALTDAAARLCGADHASVYRLEDGWVFPAASYGPVPALGAPVGRGSVVGRAVVDRRTVHVHDLTVESEAEYPQGRESQRRLGHRTVVATPLLREGQPIGALALWCMEVRPFSDKQIAVLQTFADQAVIAIENVRLFKELEARNRDLTDALEQQTGTAEILRVISQSQTDVQPVFDTIVRNAVRLCGASHGGVYRFDGELIHSVAHDGYTPEQLDHWRRQWPRPVTAASLVSQAIRTRDLVRIADVEAAGESHGLTPEVLGNLRARGARSVMTVPMFRKHEVIGAIGLAHRDVDAFSDAHVELLKTFADQGVIAIENVRLFKELEARTAALTRSVDQLTALGEVGRAVSSTLDLETVLTTIVSRAVQLSGLDGGVVLEYDEGAEAFVHRAQAETGGAVAAARRTTRIRKGEGVVGQTAITLEPVQVPDITVPGTYVGPNRENLIESGIRAIVAVPMVREDRLIGCLGVTRNRPGAFPTETIELLRTFATQSALAIQNARLFHEIEDKSRQLEAASQHKSEFLANMSHELRTPLNAVIGFSELLSERLYGELNEKQEEYLKDIHASAQHLLSLINDILDLSKIEAGRMELELTDFDLPTAIDNALILVRERAGRRGITLHQVADEGLGQIRGDERKIKQVLLNLLSNAIKFTNDGGRIEVRAMPVEGAVEVSVTDTGVGIAPEDQEAIFEEFRQVGTAAKKVEGTGLGLALSRKFVELHGGRIWVQSQEGVGSTFTFTIPLRS